MPERLPSRQLLSILVLRPHSPVSKFNGFPTQLLDTIVNLHRLRLELQGHLILLAIPGLVLPAHVHGRRPAEVHGRQLLPDVPVSGARPRENGRVGEGRCSRAG